MWHPTMVHNGGSNLYPASVDTMENSLPSFMSGVLCCKIVVRYPASMEAFVNQSAVKHVDLQVNSPTTCKA